MVISTRARKYDQADDGSWTSTPHSKKRAKLDAQTFVRPFEGASSYSHSSRPSQTIPTSDITTYRPTACRKALFLSRSRPEGLCKSSCDTSQLAPSYLRTPSTSSSSAAAISSISDSNEVIQMKRSSARLAQAEFARHSGVAKIQQHKTKSLTPDYCCCEANDNHRTDGPHTPNQSCLRPAISPPQGMITPPEFIYPHVIDTNFEFHLELALRGWDIRQEIRSKKYGEEVACRWKQGYTPQEARDAWAIQLSQIRSDWDDVSPSPASNDLAGREDEP